MTKKYSIWLLGTVLLTTVGFADAQQPKKVPKIGFLSVRSGPESREEAFRQGLRELGYVEGQNIFIESRFAEGKNERFPDLAAELVRLKADIIVAGGGSAALAAKNATKTIPIVMTTNSDPVGNGLVASLARPGGNLTGLSIDAPGISGKRLEILKESFSKLSRVAVLYRRAGPGWKLNMAETESAARLLKVQLKPIDEEDFNELENAFSAMIRERAEALVKLPTAESTSYQKRIVELAAKNRLPGMYSERQYVEIGGLMSYGPSILDNYRRAATYVDKILKGTKPTDLPVEQPMKFEFVINLKTAKQIGLTIPPNVLVRADKVIK